MTSSSASPKPSALVASSCPTTVARLARPVAPAPSAGGARRRGVGLGEATLTGGFWGERQAVNARATVWHCLDWMERLGWIANFDRVTAGETGGERPGWQFSDSEVYKLAEALAWESARSGDERAETALRGLTARIGAAQDADGYLNTRYGHPGQPGRYTDLASGHELYCTGHLLQAAVARARTVGPGDELVVVARRAADHVCREFAPGANPGICGHPEIETALVEFGRVTGEARYARQAREFVERRGQGTLTPVPLLSSAYFQDEVPVRDAAAWHGHAVRALYLAAGAVDVAVEAGDDGLLAALERQWERTVERRTYLTGGMGSRHQDEGFGDDWELPADRAYCETCAGVASVMVSWRLFLATGDVRYADLMERTFYNVIATSPRSDGKAFFYANPLQQRSLGAPVRDDEVNPRAEGGVRAPWFDVSCCPTNVARTLASWHTYLAVVEPVPGSAAEAGTGAGDTGAGVAGAGAPDMVSLLQYAPADLDVELPDGARLALTVATDYPRGGKVRVTVTSAPNRPVALRLRVPVWANGARLAVVPAGGASAEGVAGRETPARGNDEGGAAVVARDTDDGRGALARGDTDEGGASVVVPGWASVERVFAPGDEVTLDLPVAPRLTWPDPRIDAVRGCVAVERGPVVLCLESTDLPGGLDVDDVVLDPAVPPRALGEGAVVVGLRREHPERGAGLLPYGPAARIGRPGGDILGGGASGGGAPGDGAPGDGVPGDSPTGPVELRLVPYHRWAERGPATMRVFIPVR